MVHAFFLLSLVICSVFIDVNSAVITGVFYCSALICIKFFSKQDDETNINKVYRTIFLLSFIYTLVARIYMDVHAFQYILVYDTYDKFLPTVEGFLSSNSLYENLQGVWGDYSFMNRFQAGYYTFLVVLGHLAKMVNADLYFCLQAGTITICSFSSVIVYKLLVLTDVFPDNAKKYALMISCVSILFYYNGLIMRDGLIAFFFLLLCYYTIKDFSYRNLLVIIIVIFMSITFRTETGLSFFIFIPIFFYRHKTLFSRNLIYVLLGLVVACFGLMYVLSISQQMQVLFNDNTEYYINGVDKGRGIIAAIKRLPVPFGQIVAFLYTFLMPVPSWMHCLSSYDISRPECYNLLRIIDIPAAFFQCFVLISLVGISTKYRKQSVLPLEWKCLLCVSCILLFMQAFVVEQRRIMGMYAVLYMIWAINYSNLSRESRISLLSLSVVAFCGLQLLSLFL